MKRLLTVFFLCLSTLPARAQDLGQQLLEKLDQLQTQAFDQRFRFRMTTYQEGKAPVSMVFEVTIKGNKFRRVKFLEPGDIKGMRMLVRAIDQMWVYLPAYKRVRRIASHVRDQGFMGSAYSYDEMAIVTYADVFDCTLAAETATHYQLKCKRKPGQVFNYPIMEMDIRKDLHRPSEIRFYNEKGQKLKTDVREEYNCRDPEKKLCCPYKMKLTDHTRGELYTTMELEDWQVNTGVEDSFFTVSALQKDSAK
jgi:outer membrane lipoprotein-sorting protein